MNPLQGPTPIICHHLILGQDATLNLDMMNSSRPCGVLVCMSPGHPWKNLGIFGLQHSEKHAPFFSEQNQGRV